ncbi:flavin-containing monooxygenase [Novosphingopyxis sp.]|uniref:flavin-containing monooxygenase n=1 Tax=Novosphingopyxis sp. TaxID=2709690 RepID=UPI003B5AAA0B
MNNPASAPRAGGEKKVISLDAVVIGAGFSGLYALHQLRDHLGLDTRIVELNEGVGGTWYTNRYPGARCDTESYIYCYSFDGELLGDWRWSSKYPKQDELLTYFNHVTDRFALRRSIDFQVRITGATYDEERHRWRLHTEGGVEYDCQFVVTAMGTLSSVPFTPFVEDIEKFKGEWHHTGAWPFEGVNLKDKKVAVFGTGSTGVQTIPVIAKEAEHLYVVQRSPQYTIPARHADVDDETFDRIQSEYDDIWARARSSAGGFPWQHNGRDALTESDEDLNAFLETMWAQGGLQFVFGSYRDLLTDLDANDRVARFVRSKIAARLGDEELADSLVPKDHPFGSRRPVIDTNYFETFLRDNVTLIDLTKEPLIGATENGIRTEKGEYDIDVLVFATGFDAVTGPFMRLDIRGRGGKTIQQHWEDGPASYLGLMVRGFPNMFTITGPGSTFGNHAVTMEHHVEWIADAIEYMRENEIAAMEPSQESEDQWGRDLIDQVEKTVVSKGSSWWSGENIPGKKRRPLFSVASHKHYRKLCKTEAEGGYDNFEKEPAAADALQDVKN